MELEVDGDNNRQRCAWTGLQRRRKGIRRFELRRTNRNNQSFSIVVISQNTVKTAGDLMRLTDTHAAVKDYQPKLVWKTHKELKKQIIFHSFSVFHFIVNPIAFFHFHPVMWQNCKDLLTLNSFLLLIKIRSAFMSGIQRTIYIFKIPNNSVSHFKERVLVCACSIRQYCQMSFSCTISGWPTFLPIRAKFCCRFYVNLQYSLIIWLVFLSLSPHYLHCCLLSVFALV